MKPAFQFSLRSLFVVVLVSAICIFSWGPLAALSLAYFYQFAAVLLITAWWLAQRIRSQPIEDESHRTFFSALQVALPLAIVACALSLWVRHRWLALVFDDAWPQPFPYPDELLMAFAEWLPSTFPTRRGTEGEIFTIWIGLNAIALCLFTVVGALLGCVSGPIGITYWRERFARMCDSAR